MRPVAPFPDGDDVGVAAIESGDRRDGQFNLHPEDCKGSNELRAALPGNNDIAASYLEAGRFVVVRNLHTSLSGVPGKFGPSVCEPELPGNEPSIEPAGNLQVNANSLTHIKSTVDFRRQITGARDRNSNSAVICDGRSRWAA